MSGTGPSILWAHGMGVNRHMWDRQVALARERYRCVAFDARGHGESAVGARPIGIAEATEDLLAVADESGAATFGLVGASMGARTVIETTLAEPDRVQALVISDITDQSGPDAQARLRAAAELFSRGGQEALAAASSGPGAQDFIAAERAAGRDPFAGCDFPALGSTIEKLSASRPALVELVPALRSISCPVLVIYGGADEPSRGPSRLVAESIPDAALVEIPGAGHLAALSSPQAYSDALLSFLARAFRSTARTTG